MVEIENNFDYTYKCFKFVRIIYCFGFKTHVIERAKKYASKKKLSLSRLIENYLDSLTREQNDEFEISPFVKSISTGKSIPDNAEYKELREKHIDFLDKKYQ